MKKTATISGGILLLAIICTLALPVSAAAVRLKDLASVKGVRQNQLVGYGLVVGLSGTGDTNNAAFTSQGLINMMENMGVHISREKIRVRNVAGVMVTAQLPPFVKIGQAIDITISSLGDASSLQGGTLIITPLKGLDDQVYAVAQGPVSIGGFQVSRAQNISGQKNHLTVARIPNGASVEREVPVTFAGRDEIILSLDSHDFTTVARMTNVINGFLGGRYARAQDGATVHVMVPEAYQHNEVALLAALENLEVIPDSPARVVLDERTGTVVMGGNVRIGQLMLSHGNLSLQITPEPVELRKGRPGDRLITLPAGATIGEIARALNSVGASPRDLVAIFLSIKAAGALQAELQII
jgi:flagellar P-ring protein FlgI